MKDVNIKDFTWGRHRIVVPEKDCNEPLKTESSSNINQDYRQILGLYSIYFENPSVKGPAWSDQGLQGPVALQGPVVNPRTVWAKSVEIHKSMAKSELLGTL